MSKSSNPKITYMKKLKGLTTKASSGETTPSRTSWIVIMRAFSQQPKGVVELKYYRNHQTTGMKGT